MYHFWGCVVDFSDHCTVLSWYMKVISNTQDEITRGSGTLCANRILGQGHQPRTLLQIEHRCVTAHPGQPPPFPQSFLCTFHRATELLTISGSLQVSMYLLWESPECQLRACFHFPDSFLFYVTDEVTQAGIFPNCYQRFRLEFPVWCYLRCSLQAKMK